MTVIRPSAGLAIACAMALLAGAFLVGAGPQSPPPRATWHGIKTVVETAPRCESTNREEFVWVEDTDPNAASRWVSRRNSWDNSGSCRVGSAIAIVDERRTETSWSVNCEAHGQMDLNNWNGVAIPPLCKESPPDWPCSARSPRPSSAVPERSVRSIAPSCVTAARTAGVGWTTRVASQARWS